MHRRLMKGPGRIHTALALLVAFAGCRDDRCSGSLSPCDLIADAGFLCVDTQSSWSHCGACFRHCATGQRCVEGRCVLFACAANASDCVDRFTRRECSGDGRNFATYSCAGDTVCAAGRCRTWPADSDWSLVERASLEQPPDLPEWLVTAGQCSTIEPTSADGQRVLRFAGPLYARRALRLGEAMASAASVRFRALGSPSAELALFATAGSASSGIAGGVRVRIEDGMLRVWLANGAIAHERSADRAMLTLRVEQDRARDRLRVIVDDVVAREVTLSTLVLIGSHLQIESRAPCEQGTFEIAELQTWSAP